MLKSSSMQVSHDAQFQPEGCSEKTIYDAITTGVSCTILVRAGDNGCICADPTFQAGVLTQDVYKFADSVNRTIIGGYHQTIGFSGGYILVCPSLPASSSPTLVTRISMLRLFEYRVAATASSVLYMGSPWIVWCVPVTTLRRIAFHSH